MVAWRTPIDVVAYHGGDLFMLPGAGVLGHLYFGVAFNEGMSCKSRCIKDTNAAFIRKHPKAMPQDTRYTCGGC